jgi:lauroyl/myristoyl acyltransferase
VHVDSKDSALSSPPLGPSTWLTWLGALLLTLLCFLPMWLKRSLATLLATVYTRYLGKNSRHIRTVRINLSAAYPEQSEKAQSELLHHYFTTLLLAVMQMPHTWWRSQRALQKRAHIQGVEHVEQAREEGVPCILLITHTVALDAGLIVLSFNLPMIGFYKPFNNPVVDWLVRRARLRFGGQPVARGTGFREIVRQVKQHHVLCYLCDEDYGPKLSVFAPFFGHQKATLAMLPKIAKHTGAKVFPMATYLNTDTGGFDIRIEPALQDYPQNDPVADAETINAAIEQSIRYAPHQYLWKLQLFKSCPHGKDSRYLQVARGELDAKNL